MKFFSRRVIKPVDLNPIQRLFGGTIMSWIDEETAIYAGCQMGSMHIVTKLISEINFVSSAVCGDIIEFGLETTGVGRTSLTVRCEVRNKVTQKPIVVVERLVFVCVDQQGRPTPHKRSTETAAALQYGS